MVKKLFFHYPTLFSLTVAVTTLIKNALANKKIVIFTSIQIQML